METLAFSSQHYRTEAEKQKNGGFGNFINKAVNNRTVIYLAHTTSLQLKGLLSADFKKMSFCKCLHFNYL